jgi:hypothetical protein
VDKVSDIRVLKESITFAECLKGTKPIKKRASMDDQMGKSPNKIIRI